MMNSSVMIEPATGLDAYKNRTYGAAVVYKASIQGSGGERVIAQATNEEKVSRYKIFLQATEMVKHQDRLTLPAGYLPAQPDIIRVDPVPGMFKAGIHHLVVFT